MVSGAGRPPLGSPRGGGAAPEAPDEEQGDDAVASVAAATTAADAASVAAAAADAADAAAATAAAATATAAATAAADAALRFPVGGVQMASRGPGRPPLASRKSKKGPSRRRSEEWEGRHVAGAAAAAAFPPLPPFGAWAGPAPALEPLLQSLAPQPAAEGAERRRQEEVRRRPQAWQAHLDACLFEPWYQDGTLAKR